MARASRKSPSEFPKAECPHGDEAPWRVIGRHLGMLKYLHDTLDVGGPDQRKLAEEIRSHIGDCNRAIAEIEVERAARTVRAA